MTLRPVGFFFPTYFARCPPVNLNMHPLTVYNDADAVILSCYWDPGPSCILECDKVTLFALYFIITYSVSVNRTLSRLSLVGRDAVLWGKVHCGLGLEGWPSQRFFKKYKLKFFALIHVTNPPPFYFGRLLPPGTEADSWESVRQTGWQYFSSPRESCQRHYQLHHYCCLVL